MTKIEKEKLLNAYKYAFKVYLSTNNIEQKEIIRREVGGMRLMLELVLKEEEISECEVEIEEEIEGQDRASI